MIRFAYLSSLAWRLLSVAAALGFVPVGAAEPPRPITPVDYLSIPRIGDFDLTPDGKTIAYLLTETDWEDNRLRQSLWISERGVAPRLLSDEHRDLSEPKWSPDGAQLAFLANPEDGRDDQVYVASLSDSEIRQLTNHPTLIAEFAWSPDGKKIYYTASDKASSPDGEETLRDRIKPFDSRPPRFLWSHDLGTDATAKLTPDGLHVRGFDFANGVDRLVLEGATGSLPDDRHTRGGLWVVDPEENTPQRMTTAKHEHVSAKISPEGDRALFLAGVNEHGEPYYNANLFLLDLRQPGSPRLLLPDFSGEVLSAEWSRDGATIYFSANLGVTTQLFALCLKDERLTRITDGEHELVSWRYAPEAERIVMNVRDVNSPGELWSLDLANEAAPEQWTRLYDELGDVFLLPEQQVVSWQAKDGVTVEGLLTLPNASCVKPPYPLVVQNHGGPRSSSQYGLWRWKNHTPVLSGLGYATLTVNYRGSTGYGDDFLRDMVGNYFRNAHLDVLGGVDHLVEEGIADPKRMAVMGWSAGGHMTNKLITITDRFKAASSGAGAVDWISMYGESDVRYLRTPWFGGAPWEENAPLDAYIEQSPLKDLWRAVTPTLVFVGEEDPRVPRTQSILLARALTANGVPNHLYIAPNSRHDWTHPDLRLFKINSDLEWFEKYVRGREYKWQELPERGQDEDVDEDAEE